LLALARLLGELSRKLGQPSVLGELLAGALLGLIALQRGVIGEPLFVALVVMALVTSMISGPLMQRLLRGRWRLPPPA